MIVPHAFLAADGQGNIQPQCMRDHCWQSDHGDDADQCWNRHAYEARGVLPDGDQQCESNVDRFHQHCDDETHDRPDGLPELDIENSGDYSG